jgi:hypothetical protein
MNDPNSAFSGRSFAMAPGPEVSVAGDAPGETPKNDLRDKAGGGWGSCGAGCSSTTSDADLGTQEGESGLLRAATAGGAGGEGRGVDSARAKSSRTSSTAEGGETGPRVGGGGGGAIPREVLSAAFPGGGNGTVEAGCAGLLPVESSAMILRIELRISSMDGSEDFPAFDMHTLPRPARSRYTRRPLEPTHSFGVIQKIATCHRAAACDKNRISPHRVVLPHHFGLSG